MVVDRWGQKRMCVWGPLCRLVPGGALGRGRSAGMAVEAWWAVFLIWSSGRGEGEGRRRVFFISAPCWDLRGRANYVG